MKRFAILLLSSLMILAISCQKDDDDDQSSDLNPTQVQNGFAINYTATWCGYCGSWGAPRINNMGTAAPNGVVITAHASGDPMYVESLYNGLNADRPTGGGIPSFWCGDISSATESTMDALLQETPYAGVDLSYEISGTTMTIKTKSKFFTAATGDYQISCWVMEDGINGNSSAGEYTQGGTSSSYPNDDYKHNFVLRASATSDVYGQLLVSNPGEGEEIEEEFTITLDASWVDPYPGVVIWKKDPNSSPQFQYVNSIKKKN